MSNIVSQTSVLMFNDTNSAIVFYKELCERFPNKELSLRQFVESYGFVIEQGLMIGDYPLKSQFDGNILCFRMEQERNAVEFTVEGYNTVKELAFNLVAEKLGARHLWLADDGSDLYLFNDEMNRYFDTTYSVDCHLPIGIVNPNSKFLKEEEDGYLCRELSSQYDAVSFLQDYIKPEYIPVDLDRDIESDFYELTSSMERLCDSASEEAGRTYVYQDYFFKIRRYELVA